MALTLYGHPLATCTQRVATILHEKEVPFKFVTVDVATGQHKTPAYLEKQPFGQIPYIVGFFLLLSTAVTLMHIRTGRRRFHSLREPCHLAIYR